MRPLPLAAVSRAQTLSLWRSGRTHEAFGRAAALLRRGVTRESIRVRLERFSLVRLTDLVAGVSAVIPASPL